MSASALTVFGGRPVGVMVAVEEEGSVSVPFSREDGDSWTDVTGSSGTMGRTVG
jgi:hypothetical protein